MDFMQTLFTRQSCRAYQDKAVPATALDMVLTAGNAAPVGMGAYGTVHMTVIRNKDFLAALSGAAREFMKRDGDPLYGIPLMVLISAKPGMPPTIEFQNTGTIIENMMLCATDLGLGSVYLMGAVAALRSKPELVEQLHLPEGFVPIAGMGLGYPAAPLSERAAEAKIALSYLD